MGIYRLVDVDPGAPSVLIEAPDRAEAARQLAEWIQQQAAGAPVGG